MNNISAEFKGNGKGQKDKGVWFPSNPLNRNLAPHKDHRARTQESFFKSEEYSRGVMNSVELWSGKMAKRVSELSYLQDISRYRKYQQALKRRSLARIARHREETPRRRPVQVSVHLEKSASTLKPIPTGVLSLAQARISQLIRSSYC
jgi:hypothetical protein